MKFKNKGQGFALIEVMISLVVIAIALISHTQIMGKSMSYTNQTSQVTQAGILTSEIIEKIINNFSTTIITKYQQSPTEVKDVDLDCIQTGNALCTAEDIASAELREWHMSLGRTLPFEDPLLLDPPPTIEYFETSNTLLVRIYWNPDGKNRTKTDCTAEEDQYYCHRVIVRI